jgi:hypothetical protein
MSNQCVRCGFEEKAVAVRGNLVCDSILGTKNKWYFPLRAPLCCPCCQGFGENPKAGLKELVERQVLRYTAELFPMSGCMDSIQFSLEDWNEHVFRKALKDVKRIVGRKEAARLEIDMSRAMSLILPDPSWNQRQRNDWRFHWSGPGMRGDCSKQAIAIATGVSVKLCKCIPSMLKADGIPPYDPDAKKLARGPASSCYYE